MNKITVLKLTSLAAIVFSLGACTTGQLNGVGADGSFKCGRAEGIPCTSMHTIDSAISNGSLEDLRNGVTGGSNPTASSTGFFSKFTQGRASKDSTQGVEYVQPRDVRTPWSGIPVRTPEKVLRVLFFPYLDSDNDLHDQKYIYVTVAGGDWALDAARFNPRSNVFRSIYPLQVQGQGSTDAKNNTGNIPAASQSAPARPGANVNPFLAPSDADNSSLLQKAKQSVDGTPAPADAPTQP